MMARVSLLRMHESTAALAVRDVYEARTVAGLAGLAHARAAHPPRAQREQGRHGNPALATLVQTVSLLAGLVAGSGVLFALGFRLLPLLLPWRVAVPALRRQNGPASYYATTIWC